MSGHATRDRRFGRVRVLTGENNGKYPAGDSLWIDGDALQVVVDPSLSVAARSAEFGDGIDGELAEATRRWVARNRA
jgi:hypothetical protein